MCRMLAVLALATLACASAPRPAGAPPAGAPPAGVSTPVALRFAWPEGLRMRIVLQHETTRTGEQPTAARVRQVLVAEPRGNEIWVKNGQFEAQGDEPGLEENLKINEALVEVVSRDGTFLRAEGIDRALEVLDPDANRDLARSAFSRLAREDWDLMVGSWRGESFSEGATKKRRIEGSLPLLPGVTAALDAEYALAGRVACEESAPERRCVQLTWKAVPAASEKSALLGKLRSGLPDGTALVDIDTGVEASVVTDPATLVPRRIVVHEHLRLKLRAKDGELRDVEERSETRYAFRAEVDT